MLDAEGAVVMNEVLDEMIPSTMIVGIVSELWREDQFEVADVLTAIGSHPLKAVRKAAKSALHKYRSRTGTTGSR